MSLPSHHNEKNISVTAVLIVSGGFYGLIASQPQNFTAKK